MLSFMFNAFLVISTVAPHAQSEKEMLWKGEFEKICAILDAQYSTTDRELLAKDPAYWMKLEISNYIANKIVLTKDGKGVVRLFQNEGVKDNESVVSLIRIAYIERCKGDKIEFKKLISMRMKPRRIRKEQIKI